MADSYVILASASPRRAEILTGLGIPFQIDPAHIEEDLYSGEKAEQAASRLAAAKAAQVAARYPGLWVLAADTLVVLDSLILGKPVDDEDAWRILRLLSGKEHRVITAICLQLDAGPGRELIEESRVRLAALSEEEIRWYVESGEPRDKAGAYAVQGLGARFIQWVQGSYSNVMGLPARGVYRLMRDAGDPVLALLALSSP